MVLGLSLGIVFMMMRMSKVAALRTLAIGYIELIRNTPILVQVFFVFLACRQSVFGSAVNRRRSWP
ncbi:ABC transporter permease subunit (plasmid) [Neorhizobium galegae]|nr:ABC transporter permease subunit [Neorhizobium galegae]